MEPKLVGVGSVTCTCTVLYVEYTHHAHDISVTSEHAATMPPPRYSCAVYISTGLSSIAARAAAAAAAIPAVAVVDTFTDVQYARSSVKLVAEPEHCCLATRAAAVALKEVDLSQQPHPAPHPRQGASI